MEKRQRQGSAWKERGPEGLRQPPLHAHSGPYAAPTPHLADTPRPLQSYKNRPPTLSRSVPRFLCPVWPTSLNSRTISRRSPQFSLSPHNPDSGPLPASWRPRSFNPQETDRFRALRFRPGSSGGAGGSEPEGAGERGCPLPALQSDCWLLRLRRCEGADPTAEPCIG